MGKGTGLYGSAFETAWGWAALIFDGRGGMVKLLLPTTRAKAGIFIRNYDIRSNEKLEGVVKDYFAGRNVDFSGIKVSFGGMPDFHKKVYKALLKVPYGKRVTYKKLAAMAGNPNASRAVGGAMRHNPVPLIIPCHRVVRSDGAIGEFSADGGPAFKRRMLEMESR